MKTSRLGISTRAIHGPVVRRAARSPVTTPIYQSSTFLNQVGTTGEVLYTRYGNNPNQVEVAQRLAAMEGADSAIFLASGMGATALAHLAVLQPGDHLLATSWIYGGTRTLFSQEFRRLGIEVTFIDPSTPRDWRRRMRKSTRALFVETPTNPVARVLDLEPLANLCRVNGMALIVDSTFASPVNFRPLEHGADIVIHSATKYLNGHSDVIAGAGQSTVVRLIYAEHLPTEGKVHVSGFSTDKLKRREISRLRRRLGIVFQDFRLLEDRSAEKNVAFALEVTGAKRSIILPKVMRVLAQVGLTAKARNFPSELSGGELQRVAIARALVNDPFVLLADEPTGNLDERASRGVFRLIRDINANGTAVVMATHNLDLVREGGYRTIELEQGAIVFDSALDEQVAS